MPALPGQFHAGRPYFVMELVRGVKITEYCDQNQLPTRERLDLFIKVCQGIQHAHQKGIIHRDIKPSNILVTLHDGAPVPKVIDFGIAKATQGELTDKTVFTQFQQFIGTPAYISPEQAEMSGLDIDTRADIYSLGVLLYELLVGQTPFDAKEMVRGGIDALRKIIREKEPLRPSTAVESRFQLRVESAKTREERASLNTQLKLLSTALRGDLDWIVLKCLEKDRARRYETADGLAADIQRHLDNEPISARPPSLPYQVGKLLRRNRLVFAAAAIVVLALVLGAGGVMLVQYRANQNYRRSLYLSEVNRACVAWQAGQTIPMRTLLDRCPAELRHWEWKFLHQQQNRWQQKILLAATNLGGVALTADADLMVVANDGVIQVHALPSGQWLRNIPVSSRTNVPFALAPRGDLLAVAEAAEGMITIWNGRTGARVAGVPHDSAVVLAWFNDGQNLAFADNRTNIHIWNAKSGLRGPAFPAPAHVLALAFAPDDKTLAVGTVERDILLLDTSTGAVHRRLQTRGARYYRLLFSPDGRNLAAANGMSGGLRIAGGFGTAGSLGTAGSFRRDHRVWSLDDEGDSLDLDTGTEAVFFSFSADSRRLVIGNVSGMIQIWDLDRRAETERFSIQRNRGSTIRLLPDDQILSASAEGISLGQAVRPRSVSLKGISRDEISLH